MYTQLTMQPRYGKFYHCDCIFYALFIFKTRFHHATGINACYAAAGD